MTAQVNLNDADDSELTRNLTRNLVAERENASPEVIRFVFTVASIF